MFSNKTLAPIYFMAFVSCFIVFLGKHEWGWLVAAVIWLALGIYFFIKYNRNGNDLDK